MAGRCSSNDQVNLFTKQDSSRVINVLLSSFRGLGLPPTCNLLCPDTSSIEDLLGQISKRLPTLNTRLIVTTPSNQEIFPSQQLVSTLFDKEECDFLQLRLSVPLCGGKGGFGSQLRAAGGRMSSKRKKNQGDNNSSNRNLDGRRLRTVNEAKALAEYLAVKPDMDKKEREARRKRWEQVVQLAEKKAEEIKEGSNGKVDGQWVEDKEEAGERTREAVIAVMKSGDYLDNLKTAKTNMPAQARDQASESSKKDGQGGPAESKTVVSSSRSYLGFDDDEYLSESGDERPIPADKAFATARRT